jgi:TPR repeat protein
LRAGLMARGLQIACFAAAVVALSGCASLGDSDSLWARTGAFLAQSGEAITGRTRRLRDSAGGQDDEQDQAWLQEEIDQLFAQPDIDPLTLYLDEHSADERRAGQLALVAQERDQRCAAISQIYAGREASQPNLQRMRRGYLMSCPHSVQEFAARVQQASAAQTATAGKKSPPPASEPALPQAAEFDRALDEAIAHRQHSNCYLLFTIKNFTQAYDACGPIAEGGDAKAQHHMASLEKARGNDGAAFQWAQRSASQQHPPGQLLLGQLFQAGQGTRQDQAQGLALLQQAADSGLAEAAHLAGLACLNGLGVAPDPSLAEHYLQQAAREGHLPSHLALAALHEHRRPDLARHWLFEAAHKGSPEAQLALANSYAMANDGAADPKEAYVWYSLALLNGNEQAKTGLERHERMLTPEQLASAHTRIQDGINGRWY